MKQLFLWFWVKNQFIALGGKNSQLANFRCIRSVLWLASVGEVPKANDVYSKNSLLSLLDGLVGFMAYV